MKIYKNIFEEIISVESLFKAWYKFKRGKMKKKDVQEFNLNLEKHIFELHRDILSGKYKHGKYYGFYIQDPKLRHIHKAEVRDRIVHQTVYTFLTEIFEQVFIKHSYSCRINKGTHRAVNALEKMTRKITKNYTAKCYILKCDIKKFFNSVDHKILLEIIGRKIKDKRLMALLEKIIFGFRRERERVN